MAPAGQGKDASSPPSESIGAPISLVNFQAIEEPGNVWTFQGQVIGQNVAGLTVLFGGLPSLQGMSAVVEEDGWFHLTIQLQQGESGTATAQATDGWWLYSNIAQAVVNPTG